MLVKRWANFRCATLPPRRSRFRAVCLLFAVVWLPLLVSGCGAHSKGPLPGPGSTGGTGGNNGGNGGNGGNGNNGGNNGGGGTISPDARTAVLDSIEAKFATFTGADQGAENEQMLAFLKTRPEFVETGLSPGGVVWGHFADGTTLVIANNLVVTDDDLSGRAAATAAPPAPSRQIVSPALGIPEDNQVMLGGALGNGFDERVTEVEALFKARDYFPVQPAATVDALKGLEGISALYLAGHGGNARLKNGSGNQEYTVWTATRRARDGSTDQTYRADLQDGSLSYFMSLAFIKNAAGRYNRSVETHYGITTKFVQKYWTGKFTKSSLVFINACNSDSADSAGFKQAILQAGASVYLGWTNVVLVRDMAPTANYLFDRLLGTNLFSDKENPAQRPFGYGPVMLEMSTRRRQGLSSATNYDTSVAPADRQHPTGTTAKLRATASNNEFAQFAPSIEKLSVDEQENVLTLNGFFGSAEGNVLVGSTPLKVRSWDSFTIKCDIPRTGDGAAGDVKVQVSGAPTSNIVQLTEWKGTAKATIVGEGSLRMVMNFDLHFRGDVNSYRSKPHEDPFTPGYNYIGTLDSQATYEFSGTYRSPDGINEETWTGSGKIPSFVRPPEGTDPVAGSYGLVFQGEFTQERKWSLTIRAQGKNGHTVRTVIRNSQGKVEQDKTETSDVAWLSVGDMMGSLYLKTVDENFNIPAGSFTNDLGGGESISLEWSQMPAIHPPNPAGGRKRI